MMMSSWFGSYVWIGSGQPIWEKKTCGAYWCAWAASLLDVLWCMRSCFMSEFCAVFTRVYFSISSTWWYVQNIIWTIFIFEQKSNITIKLWSGTNCWGTMVFMINVHWRLSTYKTIFNVVSHFYQKNFSLSVFNVNFDYKLCG
jgi:hypothetical protein